MNYHCKLIFGALALGSAPLATLTPAMGQAPTPTAPDGANFNFIRGVVETFDPSEGLAITDHNDETHVFDVPKEASLVDQAGKPVDSSAIQPGAHVTVTVVDPEETAATSKVYRLVVANPLDDSESSQMVEGLVLRLREGQNVVTMKPSSPEAENISFTYNEGDTEFVGGDGLDVREEELQAGDRILVHLAPQEDGGVMARRIIFLGDSAEPATEVVPVQ